MSLAPSPSLMVQALTGQPVSRPPLWLMRQAGRYLPEYRAVRAKFPDFIQFCLTPDAATEVTLQPIRRFDLDAAIIFADILTIPDALGHTVTFTAGYGPQVAKLTDPVQITAMRARLADITSKLAPVSRTVKQVRQALPAHKTVIGFSGAPWTLACYLFDDKPSQGCPRLLAFQQQHPEAFTDLIEVLTEACLVYLTDQIAAGADVVQLFDSWAGSCPPALWVTAVHAPLARLATRLRAQAPHVPVILFPRLAGPAQLATLSQALPADTALSLATEADLPSVARTLAPGIGVQGNLDPLLMSQDDAQPLRQAARALLQQMHPQTVGTSRFVLNLGHGLTPDTRIERVADLARLVQDWSYET